MSEITLRITEGAKDRARVQNWIYRAKCDRKRAAKARSEQVKRYYIQQARECLVHANTFNLRASLFYPMPK